MYSIRLGQLLSTSLPQSVVSPLWFVKGKRKKLNTAAAAAADGHGRVYVSGRGAPLYVTCFLYHIPRLYCVSTRVVWHQQLLAESSHFISMLTGEKQTVQEMKRCSDSLSDYCCWWENPPLLLLYNTALIPTAGSDPTPPAPHTTVSTHSTLSFVPSEAHYNRIFPFYRQEFDFFFSPAVLLWLLKAPKIQTNSRDDVKSDCRWKILKSL